MSHDRGAVTIGNKAPVWPSPAPRTATTTSSITSRSDQRDHARLRLVTRFLPKYGVHRRLVREALMLMSELTRLLGEFLLDCQLARGRSSGKGIKLPLRRLARGRLGVHRAAAIIPFGDAHEVYWDRTGSVGAPLPN